MNSDGRVPYLLNMVLALLLIPLRVRSMSISCSSSSDTGTNRNTRASVPMVTSRPPLSLSLPRASQTLTLEPVLGRNQEFRAPSNKHSITQIKKSNLQSIVTEDTYTSASPIKIPVRTEYNAEATVHILRASPKLWNACKSNCHCDHDDVAWSPSRGIQAAEDYNQWSTGRHHLYPTTDIPAKDLPNGMGDAAISLATNIILPSMALAFDTPLEHLYFKDMFLAKYEPKGTTGLGQPGLGKHTDGSEYSFNMLLSDPKLDFQGGGTWIETVGLVKPELGDVLMHRGSILHEGCPVTDGARYVLVGFVQSAEDDNGNGNGNVQNKNLNAGDKRSELLLKHLETFPLGMVVEVDEGDEIRCATIVDVLGEGGASAAGIQRGDCIRGILASEPDDSIELIGFDGKSFDEVMEILVELSGSVQMVIERWC